MSEKKINIGIQLLRAATVPDSFNVEQGTFDIVIATENPVRTEIMGEIVNEILVCEQRCIRMQRALNGLPLLNVHPKEKEAVDPISVMGKVENIHVADRQVIGTVRLGANATEQLRSDIQNNIIDTFSVGYWGYNGLYLESVSDIPTIKITDWEMNHVAIAPIPADYNCKKRDSEFNSILTINNYSQTNLKKMTIEQIRSGATTEQLTRLDSIVSIGRSANLNEDTIVSLFQSEKTVDEIRAANPAKIEPTPINVDQIRSAATTELKTKFDAILLSSRAAKLNDSFAIELFQSGKSIEECRQAIIVEAFKSDPKVNNTQNVSFGKDVLDKKRDLAENAILNKLFPTQNQLIEGAREFRGMSVHEIALSLMAERSGKISIVGKSEMAEKIFRQRDISTSDFPLLLENVMNKSLRTDYKLQPEYYDLIANETSVSDFKAKSLYQVGSANGMKELPQGDEIKYSKLVEAKQTIKIKSFGEGLMFTRQMFIDDDLSAFSNIPSKFVRDWELTKGNLIWSMIIDNVKMDDGKALFHSDHSNLAGTAAAITDTSLSAALKSFKSQTDLGGNKIGIMPKYLIVSIDKEMEARKLLTAISPTTSGDVNIWPSMGLTLIVEKRLTGNAWYLAAQPSDIEGLYYAYLNGASGLRSNREDDFGTDSIKFGVRSEFGVAAIDHRGLYKNAGA